MPRPSTTQYLDAKILTASQPRLHLILLDGASRFMRQAKERWNVENFAETDQLLGRAADVIGEMTHGVADGSEKVSKQLEEQYAYIYRELADCRINQSAEKLNSCLKLLEYERETWLLACEKHEADTANPGLPGGPHLQMESSPASQGLSLEA
ncbi:MAG: flagellar protein FliS [Planctomycetes bacterium]|nr:flagellar protein FliS [Planctomycetota bacterium]